VDLRLGAPAARLARLLADPLEDAPRLLDCIHRHVDVLDGGKPLVAVQQRQPDHHHALAHGVARALAELALGLRDLGGGRDLIEGGKVVEALVQRQPFLDVVALLLGDAPRLQEELLRPLVVLPRGVDSREETQRHALPVLVFTLAHAAEELLPQPGGLGEVALLHDAADDALQDDALRSPVLRIVVLARGLLPHLDGHGRLPQPVEGLQDELQRAGLEAPVEVQVPEAAARLLGHHVRLLVLARHEVKLRDRVGLQRRANGGP